jgi:hypothetical protein
MIGSFPLPSPPALSLKPSALFNSLNEQTREAGHAAKRIAILTRIHATHLNVAEACAGRKRQTNEWWVDLENTLKTQSETLAKTQGEIEKEHDEVRGKEADSLEPLRHDLAKRIEKVGLILGILKSLDSNSHHQSTG